MSVIPASELWRRVAVVSGIDATYGAPFGALEVVPVAGTAAPLFAKAHQRVHGSSCRGAPRRRRLLASRARTWAPPHGRGGLGRGVGRRRSAHCPRRSGASHHPRSHSAGSRNRPPGPEPLMTIGWSLPTKRSRPCAPPPATVLLAGPGIVSHMAVPGLHDLAVSAGIGVLNTWGAKGVFDWRSQHHLATIGLQADDFVLSGLGEADLIIATGLDPGRVSGRTMAAGPRTDGPSGRPRAARRTVRSRPSNAR